MHPYVRGGAPVAAPVHSGPTIEIKADAAMNPNLFPWDLGRDGEIRSTRVVDPSRFGYPLEHSNEQLLLELGTEVGKEATDYQNPYVWQSTGVLGYPNALVPPPGGLLPRFGIIGDTVESIAMNVQASSHILEV